MKDINGVVEAVVTAVKEGEVKVEYTCLNDIEGEEKQSDWIRIATAMAGKDKGTFFMPELKDEVLVAFRNGKFNSPYIVGFLWNGKDKTPEKNVKTRMIKTKSGHKIEFNDNTGKEKILVKSQGNQEIELNDIPAGKITVKTKMGNSIVIDDTSGSITITAKTSLSINAPTISLTGSTSISLISPSITLGTGAVITPAAISLTAPTVGITAPTQAVITGKTSIVGETKIAGGTTTIVGPSITPTIPMVGTLIVS
jgi:uncharacterized protein involved in type VI secretion and phage assembly